MSPPELIIRVPGTPVAQPRVKAFRKGMHAGVYTPTTADNWKADLCTFAQRAAERSGWAKPTGDTPLCVDVDFHFRRASGIKKACRWKFKKPDRDNLDKACLDALVLGCIIADDAQVVDGRIRKLIDDDWQGAVIRITLADSPELPVGAKSKPMPMAQEALAI